MNALVSMNRAQNFLESVAKNFSESWPAKNPLTKEMNLVLFLNLILITDSMTDI